MCAERASQRLSLADRQIPSAEWGGHALVRLDCPSKLLSCDAKCDHESYPELQDEALTQLERATRHSVACRS